MDPNVASAVAQETAFSHQTEQVLVLLLVQLVVILGAARLLGALFRKLGHAQAMGEIFAGIVLGPSLFGWLFPEAFHALFPSDGPKVLPYFSHLGLVLALFLIGMEFDFREVPRYARTVGIVAFSTLAAPIAAAAALAPWVGASLGEGAKNQAFPLFFGLALAVTAIPIMGRVLIETGLSTSRVGVLALTTGALKDLVTWFLLIVAIGIARPPLDPIQVAGTIAAVLLLGVVALTVGRRALGALIARLAPAGEMNGHVVAVALAWCFGLAAATSALGVFAIFGAFLAGVSISFDRGLATRLSDRLHDLTIYLFLPIFFTSTGLKTHLADLDGERLVWVVAITVVGSAASGGVAAVTARALKLSVPESAAMGVLVNTPGLMVLILLNVGSDVGVFSSGMFAVMMANAMLRNLLVTPALRRLQRAGLPEMSEFRLERGL